MKKSKTPRTPTPALSPRRPPTTRTPISITIEPALLTQLDARGENRSQQVTQDLGRYYRLLADARTRLRAILARAELCAIIDIQNGHRYSAPLYADEILANVEDGCRLEGFDQKWEIDGPGLAKKLKTLDLLAVHALADATQRFWHAVGVGDERRDPARALD